MKKLIICLLILFSCFVGLAQPVTNRGSSTITVADSRLMALLNMFSPRYADTTSANFYLGIDSCGAIIYTYDCNCLWFRSCSPKKWVHIGSTNGNTGSDTLFAQLPAFFDSVTRAPNTILKILRGNGLFSGGVVTLDSCMTVDVTAAVYFLNYVQYTSAQTLGLVVQPADVFDRTDAVVVDTNLNVYIKKGLIGGVSPYINPSSEVLLATIPVDANVTCLSVTQEVIYDGIIDDPAQWDTATAGTLSTNFSNTNNPFHLNQAAYTITYTDSSQLIFTKPSGTDTVKASSILKIYATFIGIMNNQLKGQWFNGSTPVSNVIVFNPYFNPNDSGNYQILAIPLSAWNFSNTVFNKLIITFGGDDVAGSKGIYFDWIQLQTGVGNVNTQLTLTTFGTSGAATYNNVTQILNIPIYSGGGGNDSVYINTRQLSDTSFVMIRINGNEDTILFIGGGGSGTGDFYNSVASVTGGFRIYNSASSLTDTVLFNIPVQFNPIAGNGISITGSYPNMTFNALAGDTANWKLAGNTGVTNANFLGTTNNSSLRFRTNNIERAVIDSNGRVGITTILPSAKLEITSNNILTAIDSSQGIILANKTLSTVSNQVQYSPAITFKSHAWKINATAVDWEQQYRIYLRPNANGTTPDEVLAFQKSTNNGAWTDVLTLGTPLTPSVLTSALQGTSATMSGNISGSNILASNGIFSTANFTPNTFVSGIVIGVGAASVDSSALLDVFSTTKGVLVPRGTTTQKNAIIGGMSGSLAGGSGYTNGTYSLEPLTGGSGTQGKATITVAGGVVTGCLVTVPGAGYIVGDVLSATGIGAGTGFTYTLVSVKKPTEGLQFYDLTTHKLCVFDGTVWQDTF